MANILAYNPSTSIAEHASVAFMQDLHYRAIYAYGQNPSVQLSYVASGGSLPFMADTRELPSAGLTRSDRVPTAAETGGVALRNILQKKINQTKATVTKPTNKATPLAYITNTGDIRAMPLDAVIDELVKPAIDYLTDTTPSNFSFQTNGTYFITSNTSEGTSSLVSSQPVFTDTNANVSFYDTERTQSGLFVSADVPTTNTSYYLHRQTGVARDLEVGGRFPMYVTSTGDLRIFTNAQWDNYVGELLRWAAVNLTGYRINYDISTSSTNKTFRSTTITNTVVDSSKHFTEEVGADDYRGQSIPQGTAEVINSYYLTISKS